MRGQTREALRIIGSFADELGRVEAVSITSSATWRDSYGAFIHWRTVEALERRGYVTCSWVPADEACVEMLTLEGAAELRRLDVMIRPRVQGRPPDVCALCDTPIENMHDLGFDGPHRMTVTWDRGLHGTRSAYAHVGCIKLGQGQYNHLRDPARGDYPRFEDTPAYELAAAWARRTFAAHA